MATGLLLLGIGRATRFLTYLVGADKTYEATVRLGVETATEDADGEIVAARGCRIADLPEARLQEALTALTEKGVTVAECDREDRAVVHLLSVGPQE